MLFFTHFPEGYEATFQPVNDFFNSASANFDNFINWVADTYNTTAPAILDAMSQQ
ncbi:hypothetical protein KCQ77_02200 [Corynebacterium sp. L24]|uniref:hypothetical protein n=1 Tax=Corynebacterium parakroppenstedtii TaxID=2828363 RepID=UPI001C8F5D94|nr:hypothetical protein [Corynebacterium parakroppenstedtii]MBY0794148.1 hypothetical protein [Corynebacterium parakroppenstedtii]